RSREPSGTLGVRRGRSREPSGTLDRRSSPARYSLQGPPRLGGPTAERDVEATSMTGKDARPGSRSARGTYRRSRSAEPRRTKQASQPKHAHLSKVPLGSRDLP